MDLSQFLQDRLAAPDRTSTVDGLKATKKDLEARLAAAKTALSRHEAVDSALDQLRRCNATVFFSSTARHRFFVTRYAAEPDRHRTGKLVSLECVIVPEAVVVQNLHRPHPHEDPAKAAAGVVTMSAEPVAGDTVAAETAARYASGVRLGSYADGLVEPCASCGKDALVVCAHEWDHDSGYQWITVERLCLRCPLLQEIASESWDADEASTILPPKTPPRRRY